MRKPTPDSTAKIVSAARKDGTGFLCARMLAKSYTGEQGRELSETLRDILEKHSETTDFDSKAVSKALTDAILAVFENLEREHVVGRGAASSMHTFLGACDRDHDCGAVMALSKAFLHTGDEPGFVSRVFEASKFLGCVNPNTCACESTVDSLESNVSSLVKALKRIPADFLGPDAWFACASSIAELVMLGSRKHGHLKSRMLYAKYGIEKIERTVEELFSPRILALSNESLVWKEVCAAARGALFCEANDRTLLFPSGSFFSTAEIRSASRARLSEDMFEATELALARHAETRFLNNARAYGKPCALDAVVYFEVFSNPKYTERASKSLVKLFGRHTLEFLRGGRGISMLSMYEKALASGEASCETACDVVSSDFWGKISEIVRDNGDSGNARNILERIECMVVRTVAAEREESDVECFPSL